MFARDVGAVTPAHPPLAPGHRRRVRLRSVDAGLARLRALIGTGLCAELRVGTLALRLEVTGAQWAGSAQARQALWMQTPCGPVALAPPREIVRTLTAIDLPDDLEADPLHALRLALAARAMPQGWFELFDASAVLAAAQEEPGPVELMVTLVQPDSRFGVAAALRGTCEVLLHALSRPAWQRQCAQASPLPPDWTLKVPVQLGRAELPMRTCRALATGDVVLVQHPCFDLEGRGELRIGRRVANCTLHFGNQTLLELTEWHATTTGSTMKEPQATPPSPFADDDDSLDDLPVTLSFELGTLEMPLSELNALTPGCVLAIRGAVPPEVAVCAGGRRIGAGELVELDGRLGVEIRRIGASS